MEGGTEAEWKAEQSRTTSSAIYQVSPPKKKQKQKNKKTEPKLTALTL